MKKTLLLLVLWCVTALPLAAQTVNPNQIRPGTANGQVLTTVTANQAPSWQAAAAGVSVATTPPCTVNGGTGPISSGTATITCANNFQMQYTPAASGQYVLVYPTTCSVTDNVGGTPGSCLANGSTGSGSLGAQADSTMLFGGFTLPSGVTPANITAVYAFVISSSTVIDSQINNFSVDNTGGGAIPGQGPHSLQGPWPGFFLTAYPITPVPITAAWGSGGDLPTNYSEIQFVVDRCCNGGGYVNVYLVGLEVHYIGTLVPGSNSLDIQAPLCFNSGTNALGICPSSNIAFDFASTPSQPNSYQAVVSSLASGPSPGSQTVLFVGNANTSTAPTLAIVNAADTSPHTIVQANGSALTAGQTLQPGIPAFLIMDSNGNWDWQASGEAGASPSDFTVSVASGTQSANSCSSSTPVTVTGLTTSMAILPGYAVDQSTLTGWGSTGGMVFQIWPSSANTANWHVCNQTGNSITYSADTFNVAVK